MDSFHDVSTEFGAFECDTLHVQKRFETESDWSSANKVLAKASAIDRIKSTGG